MFKILNTFILHELKDAFRDLPDYSITYEEYSKSDGKIKCVAPNLKYNIKDGQPNKGYLIGYKSTREQIYLTLDGGIIVGSLTPDIDTSSIKKNAELFAGIDLESSENNYNIKCDYVHFEPYNEQDAEKNINIEVLSHWVQRDIQKLINAKETEIKNLQKKSDFVRLLVDYKPTQE